MDRDLLMIRAYAYYPAVLRRRKRLLSASQLIDSLSALPTARKLAAAHPISSSVQVGGIEVATAAVQDEAGTRRVWRERQRGGATPLILVTDSNARGLLSVLGPADGNGPLRQVESGPLEELLRRISTLYRNAPRLRGTSFRLACATRQCSFKRNGWFGTPREIRLAVNLAFKLREECFLNQKREFDSALLTVGHHRTLHVRGDCR